MRDTTNKYLIDLKGLTPREIDLFCTEKLGQKPGQGLRVAIWLYRRKMEDLDSMADLNRPFREQLKRHCTISRLSIAQRIASEDGTEKLLYRLGDGNTVEGVLSWRWRVFPEASRTSAKRPVRPSLMNRRLDLARMTYATRLSIIIQAFPDGRSQFHRRARLRQE